MRACVVSFLLSSLTLLPLPVRSTFYYPSLIDPDLVGLPEREYWCNQQVHNCPLLCQAPEYINNPKENSCDPIKLSFQCECPDSDIHAEEFENTFPTFVCQHNRQTLCQSENTDLSRCLSEKHCGDKAVPKSFTMEEVSSFQLPFPSRPGSNEQTPSTPTSSPMDDGGQAPAPSTVSLTFLSTHTAAATATEAVGSQTATGASVDSASTSSPSASVTNKGRGGGLSTGAKAGIAVGAIVGFALLVLLALFLLRKKRKQKQQAPLLSDEGKNLGAGPSTMSHQDPYSDSPANVANPNRFSWAPPPAGVADVPPVQQPYGDQSYGIQPASRDIASEEAAAGYWQQSAGHSPVSPQTRHSDIVVPPRTSLQEARAPASPAQQSPYNAYAPSPQSATAAPVQRAVSDDWDEDERRLEAEIAEIDRMRQVREERAAMR